MACLPRAAPARARPAQRTKSSPERERRDYAIARTTPPSTRSAAPVVADARALQT